jgi:hypothetical protein
MNREAVANELLRIAEELVAMDFPTQDAYDKYMQDHPDADKSKHSIVETKKAPAKEQKSKFNTHTDGWFDAAAEKSTHDEPVKEMKKIVEKAGTRENLERLHEQVKKSKAPWAKKVSDMITSIKNGEYKAEFGGKIYGQGKAGGYSQQSATSEFFSMLGQALNY